MKKILISLLSIIVLSSQATATLGYSSYFPSMFTAFYEIVSQKSNAGNNSIGAGFNTGNDYTDSAWVTEQTTLTGGSNVTINVGNKTTVTGAVINSESDNLTLTTKALEHSDIEDRNITESKGFGLSTSIGTSQSDKGKTNVAPNGSTTLTLKNTGEEKEQTTKATIGNGTIIIGGVEQTENDLQGLNRNTETTQETTKDQITGALDASATIDNRALLGFIKTEVKDKDGNTVYEQNEDGSIKTNANGEAIAKTTTGYQSIANDFENLPGNAAKAILGAAGTAIATGKTLYDVIGDKEISVSEIADEWKANQKTFVNQNNYNRETINNLSEGKSAEEIQAGSGDTAKIYYDEQDEANGFRQKGDENENNNYINAAKETVTNTEKFIETLGHEYTHNYTENEAIAKNAGSLAKFMWGLGNVLNFTSVNTTGAETISGWYESNKNSSLLQTNTLAVSKISDENRLHFNPFTKLSTPVDSYVSEANTYIEEERATGYKRTKEDIGDAMDYMQDKFWFHPLINAYGTIEWGIGKAVTAYDYMGEGERALEVGYNLSATQKITSKIPLPFLYTAAYIATEHPDYFVHAEYYKTGIELYKNGYKYEGVEYILGGALRDGLNATVLASGASAAARSRVINTLLGNTAGMEVTAAVKAVGNTIKKEADNLGTKIVSDSSKFVDAGIVGSANKQDLYHKAADSKLIKNEVITNDSTKNFAIKGNDGKNYNLIQTEGVVNGKNGVFEYVVNENNEITHQLFIENGKINGIPNNFGGKK
ncbi:hypothetical protein [Endomicrobium proavitum]|uniref:Uncharacterized protein n=1 Tax=Endomicrobium proavitum TaxID=1408281 RepID=A0A0G3WK25_9BACT|nr:hypothetical protein [Endomicrobium proavitum]AKL98232.1 exported protein of unknown function [Endomicrobium proavitum]